MSRTGLHTRVLTSLYGAAALSLALSTGANASPLILAGDTNASTFSNASGFDSTSTSTELVWLTTGGSGNTGGTLTIDPLAFSTSATTSALDLAELVMTVDNNPAIGTNSFNYNVALNITTPSLGSHTYVFPLSVSVNDNGSNSSNTVMNLLFTPGVGFPTSIDLGNGFTLTDFAFDATNVSAASTTFSNGEWSVTGHQNESADLFLTADVIVTGSQQQSVPEPFTLGLFGTGLCALFMLRRRARKPGQIA